ncbi:hypothetical protein EDB81DRAFT_752861 [Dactylonectria macrodidyma]|uniref:PXA domain-containing protein n=1 Tax=Dactylonectria macrodidyma TaxID=307937 RepID=A0A9P9FR89_9HYPO|nr:hypothetical protein EDB81DRAFT_752861 [Dactylonectria macrodidyma]
MDHQQPLIIPFGRPNIHPIHLMLALDPPVTAALPLPHANLLVANPPSPSPVLTSLATVFGRLLSHQVQSLLSPEHLPPLLRTVRGVLFPSNAPGTPSLFPPSSDAELQALRRRAANALWELLPSGVARLYFGGRLWRPTGDGAVAKHDAAVDELEHLLLVVDDEYCNKHLMYSVLELVLVRLMPELSEKGVVELQEERLG